MEFSEFAKTLKPIISNGENGATFARVLFKNITDYPDEDENNPVELTHDSTYKAYYCGDRKITRFAPKISKHLEPERFVTFIDEAGVDAQTSLYRKLASHCPGMTDGNIPEACADFFRDIIRNAARASTRKTGRGGTSDKTVPTQAASSSGDEISVEDMFLLNECGMRCPLCGNVLFNSKKGTGRYNIVQIFPSGLTSDEWVPYEKVARIPKELDSTDNKIPLCIECALDNPQPYTPNIYGKLMAYKKKLAQETKKEIIVTKDTIEKEIELVLLSLADLRGLPSGREMRLDALKVADKISEDNFMFLDKVTRYVLNYYRYIEGLFKKLEREGRFRYKKVRNEISTCFEDLNELDYSQSEIFDIMVQWLGDHSGCRNSDACAAIISFFVQNCEVFDEIAE